MIFHVDMSEIYDDLEQLCFWILCITATYSLVAFCVGQFLWPLGRRPSLARLFIVVSAAALILASLSPLIRKVWFESPTQ
jgi:hypothetical protein